MSRLLRLLVLLQLFVFAGGCGDSLQNEVRNPKFIRAKRLYDRGDFTESAQAFKEYLKIQPRSVKAHKFLADIYNDNLDEPLLAIYHYREYIELEPSTSEKSLITKFIEGAEKRYFKELESEYFTEADTANISRELKRQTVKNERMLKYIKKVQTELQTVKHALRESERLRTEVHNKMLVQNKEYEKKLTSIRDELDKKSKEISTAVKSQGLPVLDMNKKPKKVVKRKPTLPAVYYIENGDTLSKIAKKFYGSNHTRYIKLIFGANKKVIARLSDLKVGAKIIIPKP